MEGLTINEAAATTGWSPRMLRYIENAGLIELPRSDSGYRIFGPGELQRLRTLRELLARFDERPQLPEGVASGDWLSWEQDKHERLLALEPSNTMENAVA